LGETQVHVICRSIKLTSLRDASINVGICNFIQLFHTHIAEEWGHEVSGLVLGYDQNVLIDNIFIKLQNGQLYYHQRLHCLTSVGHLGLHCKVEHTKDHQEIMPESHAIWVEYTDNVLNYTFPDQVPSFPVLYFRWILQTRILQFQERLPARKTIPALPKRCNKTPEWILRPQSPEYVVVITTKY
jgi:hypothetical protein